MYGDRRVVDRLRIQNSILAIPAFALTRRAMKLVTTIIKPHMLNDVRDALTNLSVTGLTMTEVKGFGRQERHTEIYRGEEYSVDFVPKVNLEIVVADEHTEARR